MHKNRLHSQIIIHTQNKRDIKEMFRNIITIRENQYEQDMCLCCPRSLYLYMQHIDWLNLIQSDNKWQVNYKY